MAEGVRPVVWISHGHGEPCASCRGEIAKGVFVQIDPQHGARCMECAGLADLVYLPAGDPALTRRALALSSRSAVVVKFSRARKRNERQGVLVDAQAVEQAEKACKADAARREGQRARRLVRDEAAERAYLARFTAEILAEFPACPRDEAETIARRACEKYSGRVGRSAAAKALEPGAIVLAVRAHVRHHHTGYDDLLARGLEPSEARPLVANEIEDVLDRWRRDSRRR